MSYNLSNSGNNSTNDNQLTIGGYILSSLNKIDTLLIKKIPYQVYIFLSVLCLAFVGQAVYDYQTQEQPVNLSFSLDDTYTHSSDSIVVADSYTLNSKYKNAEPIFYDEDLFYSTGKLEVKK